MKHTKNLVLRSDMAKIRYLGNTAEVDAGASFTVDAHKRALINFSLPGETLPPPRDNTHLGIPRSAVFRSAILSMRGAASKTESTSKLALYRLATDNNGREAYNEALIIDYEPLCDGSCKAYSFDITAALRSAQLSDSDVSLLIAVIGDGSVELGGIDSMDTPTLTLTYETSYGEKAFGKTKNYILTPRMCATVDLVRKNLMYSIDDFTVGEGHTPFVVRHVYNSAMAMKMFTKNHGIDTAHFSPMRLGYGWRLNLFRSIIQIGDFYVYTDEKGDEHALHMTYNGLYGDEEVSYSPATKVLTGKGFSCRFDGRGRMVELSDGMGNVIYFLHYVDDRIATMTSLNVTYEFSYSEYGYLERVSVGGEPVVRFGCRNGFLTYVWHGDELAVIEYVNGTKDLNATPENACSVAYRVADGHEAQKTVFTFEGDCVKGVSITADNADEEKTESYDTYDGECDEIRDSKNLLEGVGMGDTSWHGVGSFTPAEDGGVSLEGSLENPCFAYKEVAVDTEASCLDHYILSVAAKAASLPDRCRADGHCSVFGIRAEILYADGESEAYHESFSALTDERQYATLSFAKRKYKAIETLRVFCEYSHQIGTAYFDEITLICSDNNKITPFDMGAHTAILRASTEDGEFISYDDESNSMYHDHTDYIHVCRREGMECSPRITISEDALPLPHGSKVIDATLILYPAKVGIYGAIRGKGKTVRYTGKPMVFPLHGTKHLNLFGDQNAGVDAFFYKKGEYAPLLIVKYVSEEKPLIAPREVMLTDAVHASLNIEHGELSPILTLLPQSSLPLAAVHASTVGTELGKGMSHTFSETLHEGSKSNPYVYTDSFGHAHAFKERFYYSPTAGVYEFVKKEEVLVRPDGTLWCGDKPIVREVYTEDGWVAKTELRDIDGADILEQRSKEMIQAEEELDSYRLALSEYAVVTEEDGSETAFAPPTDYDGYRALLALANEGGKLLLGKGDALGYRNLLYSAKELDNQCKSLTHQMEAVKMQEQSISQQIHGCQLQMQLCENAKNAALAELDLSAEGLNLSKECVRCHMIADCPLCDKQKDACDNCNTAKAENFADHCPINSEYDENDKEFFTLRSAKISECQILQTEKQRQLLFKQCKNTQKQYACMEEQKNLYDGAKVEITRKELLNAQRAEYKRLSARYIEQLEKQVKAYFTLEAQLANAKKALPVRYMVKGGVTKCFNESGELCMISYGDGRAWCAERDSQNRIVRLVDESENVYQLSYADGLLTEIASPRGERATLRYENGMLRAILSGDNNEASLVYDTEGRLSEITSRRDAMRARLFYDENGRICHILRYSAAYVAHGDCGENDALCSEFDIAYTGNTVTLRVNGHISEQYILNLEADTPKVEHRSVSNDLVIAAEQREYVPLEREITVKAKRECLGKAPAFFSFEPGERITRIFNVLGDPISEESDWFPFHEGDGGTALRRFERSYTYDAESRSVIARTEVSDMLGDVIDTHTEVQRFGYNENGAIVYKEGYIEGEEYIHGKSIEETIYDEHGNFLRTVSYNTLAPSSKQYSEVERDGNGRVLAALDATGLHKVSYEYKDNGSDTVITEHKPNGARLSFGSTRGGHTAITLSTEAGEENSNTVRRTAGLVTELESDGRRINYRYDGKRRISAVELDGEPYIAYAYEDNVCEGDRTVDRTTATLPDGTRNLAVYDKSGNLLRAERNSAVVLRATYDAFGKPATHYDAIADTEAEYKYDSFDRITSYTRTKDGATVLSEQYGYDDFGKLVTHRVTFGEKAIHTAYTYREDAAKTLDSLTVNSLKVRPVYDALGRAVGRVIKNGDDKIAGEQVSLRKVGDHTTAAPAAIRFERRKAGGYTTDGCLQYRYDAMGNITEIREDGKLLTRYIYDAVGRLVREDNRRMGRTTLFTYDNRGNILSREVAAYTACDTATDEIDGVRIGYEYEGERLMRCGDEVFAYDAIGNPTTYRGKAAAFANGRQMVALDGNTFTYDGSGRRMSKNGISFLYDSHGNLISSSDGLTFLYDHAGLCGVTYGENTYIYRKDAQGNIIALLDKNGTIVVKYTYDAWGNHTVEDGTDCSLGTLNPFRYRGYYYDTETGLYYLQTRYYDPEIGRFITIDDVAYLAPDTIGGLNLYAYCNNNPVMCVDPKGTVADDSPTTEWDTAILVTYFKVGEGLPIVGHTQLFFYNTNTGEWYSTQFGSTAGEGATIREKINSAAIIEGDTPPPIYANGDYFSIIHNYVVLEGDFDASVKSAKDYCAGKKEIGKYNFFFNNCARYTRTILAEANTDNTSDNNTFISRVIACGFPISVPLIQGVSLSVARTRDLILADELDEKVNHIGDTLGFLIKTAISIKNLWSKIKSWK